MELQLSSLRTDLAALADPADALSMAAYMKGQFPFLGLKSPKRKAAQAAHIKGWFAQFRELDLSFVRLL